MALSVKVGSFTRPASGTTDSVISGLGFAPTCVIFLATHDTSAGSWRAEMRTAIGWAAKIGGDTTSIGQASGSVSANDGTTPASYVAVQGKLTLRNSAGTVQAEAASISFGGDGFTINWSDSPYDGEQELVVYLALGGDALAATNAYSFTAAELLGESPSRLHGLHFEPDAALVIAQDASGNEAQSFGVAASSQWAIGYAAQSGANPSNTWRKLSNQGAIELLNPNTGARRFAASLGMSRTGMSILSLKNVPFGTYGSGNDQLNTPDQVAFDSSGNVFVADSGNGRLKKHDSDGAYVSSLTGLTGVTGVCLDSTPNIYAAWLNAGSAAIRKTNSAFGFISGFTHASNMFAHLATDSTYLFVTNQKSNAVVRYSTAIPGTPLVIGSAGSGDGQFQKPVGIATDGTHIYVADATLNRVQKFTTAGVFVAKWGGLGSGPGEFSSPRGVAVDDSGNLWVADYGNQRLQKFSNSGTWLQTMPLEGNPSGVAATSGRLAVSLPNQHKVLLIDNSDVPSAGIDLRVLYLGGVIATAGVSSKPTGSAPASHTIATGIRPKAAIFGTHADTQLNTTSMGLRLDARVTEIVRRHRRVLASHEAAHAVAVLVYSWDPVTLAMVLGEREEGTLTVATDAGEEVLTDFDQLPHITGHALFATPPCPEPGPEREAWALAGGTIAWIGVIAGNRWLTERGHLDIWPEDLPLMDGDGTVFARALAATTLSHAEFEHACTQEARRILRDYETEWRTITDALLDRCLLRWPEVAALSVGQPIENAPAFVPLELAPFIDADEATGLRRHGVPLSLWRPEHLVALAADICPAGFAHHGELLNG